MAPGFSAGSAFFTLRPRLAQGWSQAVEKEVDGPLRRMSGKMAAVGKGLAIGLGAAAVGVGAVGLAIGKSFDDAYDTIRLGTGAVGEDLEALKGSFRSVAKQVPNDFGEVSTAIADLNTRTGLTGTALEDLAVQTLTLSRLTGQDLATTIQQSTRLFGDWGIAVEDQEEALDKIWRASQATGIEVGVLQEKLTKFGGPLRQLGFSMEEGAAILGKFEKEGVNADLVMGSLRIALGKMARAGEAPAETLARTTEEIKNAGSAGEANALALELFGAKAGPDMAAAIREGRFEIGDLLETVESGSETIGSAADDTDDFAETFSNLKNRVVLALEPLGVLVFDVLNGLMDRLAPVADWIGERLPGALATLQGIAEQVIGILFRGDFTGGPFSEDAPIVGALFTIRERLLELADHVRGFFSVLRGEDADDSPLQRFAELLRDQVWPWVQRIRDFLQDNLKEVLIGLGVALGVLFAIWVGGAVAAAVASLAAAAVPLLIVAGIAALVAGFLIAYKRIEGFRNLVDGVVAWVKTNVPPMWAAFLAGARIVFDWLKTNVPPVVAAIVSGFQTAIAWLQANVPPVVQAVVGAIMAAFHFLRDNVWPIIQQVFGGIVSILSGVVAFAVETWPAFQEAITHVFNVIRPIVAAWVGFVSTAIGGLIAGIVWAWETFGVRIVSLISTIWDQVLAVISYVINLVQSVISFVLAIINGDWGEAWQAILDGLTGTWDLIKSTIENAGMVVYNALSGILDTLRSLWDTAWDAMKGVFEGLFDGLTDGARAALNMMLNVLERGINLGISALNAALDGIDAAAGPWVNFGEIPEVELPRLEKGGRLKPGQTAIVGDRGNDLRNAELFTAGPAGGRVFPHRALEELLEVAGGGARGAPLWEGDVNVDARGIEDPQAVGDLTSRMVAWRVGAGVPR